MSFHALPISEDLFSCLDRLFEANVPKEFPKRVNQEFLPRQVAQAIRAIPASPGSKPRPG
jgi:hypothetical protein